jgi:DNA processing protein
MVAAPEPDNNDITDWLTLYHAPGVGAVTFVRLLDQFGNAREILRASSSCLQAAGLHPETVAYLRQPDRKPLDRDLAWLDQPRNRIITCRDPDYPSLLLQIPDSPPVLYVHGRVDRLSSLQFSMVGSRNPTVSGYRTASEFASHLALAGLTITSGLALGIDAASHSGALEVGKPTIAVMGTGLDRVYPASHRDLAHSIAEHGALVSEFPVGTPPRPENFPRRNRIISGLSLGTLVVEAATRSGSLISARCAAEQGREVFAIPGSIHNPLSRGCHALIRQGAKLVETAQDILDELGTLAVAATTVPARSNDTVNVEQPPELADDYMQLLDSIGFSHTSVDMLVETSGLTPAVVSSMLLQLELKGFIASCPGGRYNRLK